jgi:hypothetical protein
MSLTLSYFNNIIFIPFISHHPNISFYHARTFLDILFYFIFPSNDSKILLIFHPWQRHYLSSHSFFIYTFYYSFHHIYQSMGGMEAGFVLNVQNMRTHYGDDNASSCPHPNHASDNFFLPVIFSLTPASFPHT